MVSPLYYWICNILITLLLGWTIIVNLIERAYTASLKILSQKNPMGQKPNKRKKEYSALNVHIAPPEMNNLNLATC